MRQFILSLILLGSLSCHSYAMSIEIVEDDGYGTKSPIMVSVSSDLHEYEGDELYVMARSILDISPQGSDLEEWGYLNTIYYMLKGMNDPERDALIEFLQKIVEDYSSLDECIEALTGRQDLLPHGHLESCKKLYSN